MNLCEKYRPKSLVEIRGQVATVSALASFVKAPVPCAFIFSGAPGTGKTSAALALAGHLGCDVAKNEWGGVHQIASGELTAENVREMFNTTLRYAPWHGSGWKVLICNEADNMSDKAAFIFLDVLEKMPTKTVVVFTTNSVDKLSKRFRERCEHHSFRADDSTAAQSLIDHIWTAELGHNHSPKVAELSGIDAGEISFRAVIRAIEPAIRAELASRPTVMPIMPVRTPGLVRVTVPAKPAPVRVMVPVPSGKAMPDAKARKFQAWLKAKAA